jgi:hypothetical protein
MVADPLTDSSHAQQELSARHCRYDRYWTLYEGLRCTYPRPAHRFQELQRLFENGLITRVEYDEKRAAILKGL